MPFDTAENIEVYSHRETFLREGGRAQRLFVAVNGAAVAELVPGMVRASGPMGDEKEHQMHAGTP